MVGCTSVQPILGGSLDTEYLDHTYLFFELSLWLTQVISCTALL